MLARLTAITAVAMLVAALGQASAGPGSGAAGQPAPGAAGQPASDAARGLVYAGLRPATSGPCAGGFEVVRLPGQCTHGPDAAPPGMDVRRPWTAPVRPAIQVAPDAILCDGDGQAGNRVQVLYVHPPGVDRYATLLPRFRQVAAEVDDMVTKSAQATGGTRHVRYVTTAACQVSVLNIQLSATSLGSFGDMVSALQALGHNRTDRKYLSFVEATVYCGLGSLASDSSPGSTNLNNRGPHYARVDQGCWDNSLATEVAAHEMTHNLGAVQLDAPHTTTRFHCTDEHDRMCGADGPDHPPVVVCPDPALDMRFDCNHDDYFTTNPVPGSYLANHWNVANSSFLLHGGPSAALTGNWDGAGGSGIGVAASYGGPEWELALRDQLSIGPPGYEPFRFGGSGCVPLTGDWNGDGRTTTGVACKRTGSAEWWWSLRDSLSSGTPSVPEFGYGNAACTPVTGDWNGDGSTTIGAVCKNNLEWRWNLRNANSAGAPSYSTFGYGNIACTPVTGDWNGDRATTIGVACKNSLEWQWNLRNANSAGAPSYSTFGYGNNSCTPVTGDWNGDSSATIGVACKGPLLWEWSLRNAHSGGTPSYPPFRFGNSN